MKNFINIIKDERKRQKINQKEMGQLLVMSESNYRDIESGKTRLSLDIFLKSCKVLNLNPLELINDNQNLIIINDEEYNILINAKIVLNKIIKEKK